MHQRQTAIEQCPTLPGQKATLFIDGIETSSNYHTALRSASLLPALQEYMIKTNKRWTNVTIRHIDWTLHNKALNRLATVTQKTIRQLLHNWLPVNAHKGSAHAISALCPICNTENETQNHFTVCTDTRSKLGWKQASSSVRNKANKLTIDPMLTRLMVYALENWRNQTNPPPFPNFLPLSYRQLFKQQSQIGWDQLIKGRLTSLWVHQQDLFSSHNQGLNKLSILVSTIFTEVYRIWKDRCNIQHGKTQTDIDNKIKNQIEPRVQALYATRTRLNNIDQLPFDTPIEAIMAFPLNQLEHWLKRTTKIVKAGLIRARHQDRLQMRPLQFYFPIRPTPPTPTPVTRIEPTAQPTDDHTVNTRVILHQLPKRQQFHQIFHQRIQCHPSVYKPP
jgi:hypothetical protein